MSLNKSIAVSLVPLVSWWGWGRGDDMLLRKINTIDGVNVVDNENKLQEEIWCNVLVRENVSFYRDIICYITELRRLEGPLSGAPYSDEKKNGNP